MTRWMEDTQGAANRRTRSLAGLAATLGLVVASLYLVGALRQAAAVQDCVLSGRSGCLVVASR